MLKSLSQSIQSNWKRTLSGLLAVGAACRSNKIGRASCRERV